MPDTTATTVDWEALRAAAREVVARAYVPYSGFPVGAAALVDDGRIVVGCNVENAAYGVTLCAECSLVSALVTGGGGRLVAFICVDGAGRTLMPCGRCRQLLWEHGGPESADGGAVDLPLDSGRTRTILQRRSTPAVRAFFESYGIARATVPRPLGFLPHPDLQF